jgi:hypothetical protein
MGENMTGTWSIGFKQRDSGDRGLIIGARLQLYYTKSRPKASLIDQVNGSDPFMPLKTDVVRFNEPYVIMTGGRNFSTNVTWSNEPSPYKKKWYNAWLQANGQRVKLRTHMENNNETLVLDYVPSVFANGTHMNLTYCESWRSSFLCLVFSSN